MSKAARLGAFILVTLAILVAGVLIIGSQEYMFSSTYQLRSQFDNVAGLTAGADVQVGGVHSGTVRAILLPHSPDGKVTVIMDLVRSTHEIIKQDSVASIDTEGLLGSQFLAISFGTPGKPDVRSGDSIASYAPLEMTDILKKANAMLDSSQQALANTTEATANLKDISAKINSGQGTVGALVNDKQLYNNLEQSTNSMHDTMIQAQAGVTDFQENMEALKHNFLLRGYFKDRGYEDTGDLTKDAVELLPDEPPAKSFVYQAKQVFDKVDSAKLKNQRSLDAAGKYLSENPFGYAVVVACAGMAGDSQTDLVLTQARAMVVREYLVQNFGFDDSQLKTLGMGKQPDTTADAGWGSVKILIYPARAVPAPNNQPQPNHSPATASSQPVAVSAGATHKP